MTIQTISDESIAEHFNSQAYQLFEKIGEGGFGRVYRAKQVNTGQIVAIKFLSLSTEFDEAKKQRYIERFERETLLCSRLQHPNIVRLLDKGRCGDLLYAVFEYVEGKTLRQTLLDAGSLFPVEAAEIMAQVLDALSHAHEQGVIHRDIKPANIMLTKTGAKTHAKILDFGIGTLVNEVRQLDYKSITLTQETLGTPSYSAPEQLRGEPPTTKTDIYVWGLVFIECLTGQPTISGASLAAVFHKQLSQSNVPLPAALAGHTVAALLRRVLQKKANERAADAGELYNEFTQLNFSTLVGDLTNQSKRSHAGSETTAVHVGDDETQLHYSSTQTSLTERKQISTLCVALNMRATGDETAIDYEVADALHRDQKSQCVDIAVRFGAFHVGTVGNTLLFYFGYPTVSDNDSRLCARTALEIVSKLHNRNSLLKQTQGIEVLAHLGMHTGVITTYADATPEGESANIAMDLARLADANQVLCTEGSKELLDTHLEFQSQQSSVVGICNQQIPLYSLVGERQVEAFGFLRANKNNYDFIGRDVELTALKQLLSPNHRENKNIAHIHGEAGIGKSRLVFELRNLARGFTHYVAQCLPEHKNNALYPILNVVNYKYSLASLTPEAKVQKLRSEMNKKQQIKEQDVLPILCSWLALPLPKDISATAHSPDVQKQILFDALITLLSNQDVEDSPYPVLFLFEDMHWADPTSIEFVSRLSANSRFRASNDVFVSTSRQPLPDKLSTADIQSIELLKLSQEKTSEFVLNLFNNLKVSDRLLNVVVTRTDGIPLFIEELVDMLKHKGLVEHLNGITDFVSTDVISEVPSSLRDSLQQKLDTLVYAKETAQLAATIGREFDYGLLAAASNHSQAQLQIDLNELVEAELVFLQRKVAGDSYIFKHALVRDAAYESGSSQFIQRSHRSIADSLINHFATRAEHEPVIVAKHYASAKEYLPAVKYGVQSIYNLGKNSFNQEAIALEKEVRSWIESLDVETGQVECKIRLNATLLPIRTMLEGWGNKDVYNLAEENIGLIQNIMDKKLSLISDDELDDMYFKAKWTLFFNSHLQGKRGEDGQARTLGEALIKEVLDTPNDKQRVRELVTRVVLAQAYFFDADFNRSKDCFSIAIGLYDESIDGDLYIDYVIDPYLFSAGNLVCLNVIMGDHTEARRYCELCLQYAENTKNSANIATAYAFGGCMRFVMFDREAMRDWTNEAVTTYGKSLESSWVCSYLYMLHDWPDRIIQRSADIVKHEQEQGLDGFMSWYAASLADTYIYHRKYEEAIALMNSILDRSLEFGDPCILSMNYRFLAIAQYHQSGGLCDKTLKAIQQAIQCAYETDSKWLEYQAIKDYLVWESNAEIIAEKQTRLQQLLANMQGIEQNHQYSAREQ
ncbi:MAG: TOMM system kinase/cyclase fusion protein [Algicola sp.]|nr:TOMM system kinase/cyclase fusion protein [Algicola sp.]